MPTAREGDKDGGRGVGGWVKPKRCLGVKGSGTFGIFTLPSEMTQKKNRIWSRGEGEGYPKMMPWGLGQEQLEFLLYLMKCARGGRGHNQNDALGSRVQEQTSLCRRARTKACTPSPLPPPSVIEDGGVCKKIWYITWL